MGVNPVQPMSAKHKETKERRFRSRSLSLWFAAAFVLIVGLILWIGVFSDGSGHLTMPGTDGIAYVATVIFVVGALAYWDRRRN